MTGRIVTLNFEKQYGFIESDDNLSSDVFFHRNSLVNRPFEELAVGEAVEFALQRTEKGLRGADVAVL